MPSNTGSTLLPPRPDVPESAVSLLPTGGSADWVYQDGSSYSGTWGDGRRHGYGVLKYANGDVYEGSWVSDMAHGQGTFREVSGERYVGEWRDDLRHGKGTHYRSDGVEEYNGDWRNDVYDGYGALIYDSGDRYEGDWKQDQRHGTGKLHYRSGDTYDGQWRNDRACGHGTLVEANGNTYVGDWEHDRRHGNGETYLSTGRKLYDGQWRADQYHGHGVLHYEEGGGKYEGSFAFGLRHGAGTSDDGSPTHNRYVGQWKRDQYDGRGTLFYGCGDKYEGEWSCGKACGYGVFTSALGEVYKGHWKDDARCGYGTLTDASGMRLYSGQWVGDQQAPGSPLCTSSSDTETTETSASDTEQDSPLCPLTVPHPVLLMRHRSDRQSALPQPPVRPLRRLRRHCRESGRAEPASAAAPSCHVRPDAIAPRCCAPTLLRRRQRQPRVADAAPSSDDDPDSLFVRALMAGWDPQLEDPMRAPVAADVELLRLDSPKLDLPPSPSPSASTSSDGGRQWYPDVLFSADPPPSPPRARSASSRRDDDEVRGWLARLRLSHLTECFQRHDIDLPTLRTLTETDLEKIGIGQLGARKRILATLQAEGGGGARPAAAAPAAAAVHHRLEPSSQDCVVCWTAARNVAVDPCGHIGMCSGCAERVSTCPICRGPVAKLLLVFNP
eukprot:TRINITY_DN21269_c0_g1_i1.p1 TRINITY_DN21269_c0_g1~~TRINITY_DN21269_c0_g1_i1.p1  ORF type:complete len:668 (+),score=145.02 TRINITY_DN21269_c0_g1_i1:57-2060(+)